MPTPYATEGGPFYRLYCTDEDVYRRVMGDYERLAPAGQMIALGDDGLFAPGDPWRLSSLSNPFDVRGLAPGHVVAIVQGGILAGQATDYAAVEAVDGDGSATLRRPGELAGVGAPPGLGVAGPVGFKVPTVKPQIADATERLRNRFRIGLDDRRLADISHMRRAAVLVATLMLYGEEYAGPESKSDWAAKAKSAKAELAEEYDWLGSLYGADDPGRRATPARPMRADDPGREPDGWGFVRRRPAIGPSGRTFY